MNVKGLAVIAMTATCIAAAADAATVRLEYNTNADNTRTGILPFDIVSGPSDFEAGQYTGTVANVTGYLDLDLGGAAPTVIDYNLTAILPHGVPTGLAELNPSNGYPSPGPTASTTLTPAGATADNYTSSDLISINQIFQFDTRFGPQPPNLVYYDPADDTLYPFLMTIQFLKVDGAGLNGGPAFQVRRLQMSCAQTLNGVPYGAGGCNGYTATNFGMWNSNGASGLPFSIFEVADNGPGDGEQGGGQGDGDDLSAVPLPAGFPLVLSGLAVLGFLRRRKA